MSYDGFEGMVLFDELKLAEPERPPIRFTHEKIPGWPVVPRRGVKTMLPWLVRTMQLPVPGFDPVPYQLVPAELDFTDNARPLPYLATEVVAKDNDGEEIDD